MARRMTLEGAKVKAVVEIMPYSGGLKRNIVQCLDDFGIPLKLSHTITNIHGKDRVEGVTIAKVDENRAPVKGTEEFISCDTLLLSVGLIPENELSKTAGVELSPVTGGPVVNEMLQTNTEGVFACGNVLHVHDLVDFVSEEAYLAGQNAAKYVLGHVSPDSAEKSIRLLPANGVRYTVPEKINPQNIDKDIMLRFRVDNIYKGKKLAVYFDGKCVSSVNKKILAPGEMEQIRLPKALFDENPDCRQIKVTLE
jgi:NAD(P)H-nitrite reductase large subunit